MPNTHLATVRHGSWEARRDVANGLSAVAKLETNVRDDAALIADFVDSVREHGVINPIVAVRGDDGVVRVRSGQRRAFPGKLPCCLGRCWPRAEVGAEVCRAIRGVSDFSR